MDNEQENSNSTPPRRAFNAAIGTDWLITEDAFRTVLSIAARLPAERAVEAAVGEPLEYTREVTVRDGVAVIPVDGPIFRYANLFTYFSGGSTIEVLAKDLTAALNSPKVHAILFEINSPGGEVTGVNEFCEMVYNARSRKPITARVGGLGCSAAYWIASACGDIVIDETAQLGSIGVMAVYTDDRKNLELNGLEEIEFISSQSPFKNAPPWSDEGRSRIQRRIDALAQVFVEKVARNRGISTEDVLKNYGQGDVFVGQAAIAAGLADRMGSFEEAVRDLARAHNPYYVEPTDSANEKTINLSDEVKSFLVDQDGGIEAGGSSEGNTMSEQNNIQQEPAAPAATTTVDNPQAQPAAAAAAPAPATDAASPERMAQLEAELAQSRQAAEAAQQRIAALEQAATEQWISEQVQGLAGARERETAILGALVAAHGRESEIVATYLENGRALRAQINASGLFGEIGSGGASAADSNGPEAQLEKLARDRAASDKITYEAAYKAVLEENPELAKQVI